MDSQIWGPHIQTCGFPVVNRIPEIFLVAVPRIRWFTSSFPPNDRPLKCYWLDWSPDFLWLRDHLFRYRSGIFPHISSITTFSTWNICTWQALKWYFSKHQKIHDSSKLGLPHHFLLWRKHLQLMIFIEKTWVRFTIISTRHPSGASTGRRHFPKHRCQTAGGWGTSATQGAPALRRVGRCGRDAWIWRWEGL